jgi:hypothetical protein
MCGTSWNRRATPQVETAPSIGQQDLSTSEGGRAYIAEFFATRLRRHDFQRYIEERLAADFACALAGYLSEHVAAIAAGGAQEARYEVSAGSKWTAVTQAQYEAWSGEKRIATYTVLPRVAATVPEGFALVPVVMTAAMINAWAGGRAVSSDEVAARTPFQDAWKRVLAAASNGEQA